MGRHPMTFEHSVYGDQEGPPFKVIGCLPGMEQTRPTRILILERSILVGLVWEVPQWYWSWMGLRTPYGVGSPSTPTYQVPWYHMVSPIHGMSVTTSGTLRNPYSTDNKDLSTE